MTVPFEALADGFLVTPQPCGPAPATPFGESTVESLEALGQRDRDQEVPPDEANQSLDFALVIPLARSAEPVLEQIVGLQLREDARSRPLAISQDPGNSQLGVVVQDGCGNAAEEGKCRNRYLRSVLRSSRSSTIFVKRTCFCRRARLTLTPKSGPDSSSAMRPERWSYPSWPVPASGSRCSSGAVVGYRRSRCTRIAQPWPGAG